MRFAVWVTKRVWMAMIPAMAFGRQKTSAFTKMPQKRGNSVY